MNQKDGNPSIKCLVPECAYHCSGADYCTLASIQVGTHEKSPTESKCTDCQSFAAK